MKAFRRRARRAAFLALMPAIAAAPLLGQSLLPRLEFGLGDRIATAVPPPTEARTIAAGGQRPSLNFYGQPGAIVTPSAFSRDVGEFAITVSDVDGITRGTLSFQPARWFSGSFRYTRATGLPAPSTRDAYYDRSFDLRVNLLDEGRWLPALAVGLQDFGGTGLDSAEYVVASRTLRPGLTASVGLGWGRLATLYDVGAPGGDRPGVLDDPGGQFSPDDWFRGPVAPFASLEWLATDRLGFKLEYSADSMEFVTTRDRFGDGSRLSLGVEYQATPGLRVGAYALRGEVLGLSLQYALNPRRPIAAGQIDPAAPTPIQARPPRAAAPEQWTEAWIALPGARDQLAGGLTEAMDEEDLRLLGLSFPDARQAIIRFEGGPSDLSAQNVGRVARIAARRLPPSVEVIRIVPVVRGLDVAEVRVSRTVLEQAETAPGGTARLAREGVEVVTAARRDPDAFSDGIWPRYRWNLGPYLSQRSFDPDEPIDFEAGLRLSGQWQPAPGLVLAGSLSAPLLGEIGEDADIGGTLLPRVRTDSALFGRDRAVVLDRLTVAQYGRIAPDVYSRLTAGYLERAYGGLSGELLWAPPASRLALGVEANAVRKRDYDQAFGFQDFDTWTAFASGYYAFGQGWHGQLDVGRYLAGDVGATVSLDRVFENGWRVGAFATFTSASAEEFGEGSFDKGIRLAIPATFLSGDADGIGVSRTIRPILRDGGARLSVDGRLYGVVRGYGAPNVAREFGSFLR